MDLDTDMYHVEWCNYAADQYMHSLSLGRHKLSIIIYTNCSYLKSLTFGQLCVDKNLDT